MSINKFSGARWWKFDFHTHTPKSTDYGRGDEVLKNITAKGWLLDHMKAGIECVAVTDHDSGEWIDPLKTAYESLREENNPDYKELHIFPGVEISVSGGIHLLAILDKNIATSDISRLLGACGASGASDACTSKSVIEVIKEIHDFGGIAIPAHIDDSKGFFSEIRDGKTIKGVIKLRDELYAAEITDSNYEPPELYKSEKAHWSFVFGSDSHMPREINRRFTWVKMGDPSLEGLKLALLDKELSIKRSDEYPECPNKYSSFVIKNIEIRDARYCGNGLPLNISFSPWLNCIIGGRGTGKSTIIEFLRIVLRRDKELDVYSQLKQSFENFNKIPDPRSKIGALRENTQIIAECLKDETIFLVQWANDNTLPSILEKDDKGSFIESRGEIDSRFPIRIYSQKQIFEMADSPEALLQLIDESSEIRQWKDGFEQECAKYRLLKARIRELDAQMKNEESLLGEYDDIKKKIAIFEQGKNADILKKYQSILSEEKEISTFGESMKKNAHELKNASIELINLNLDIINNSSYSNELLDIITDFKQQSTELNIELSNVKTKFSALIELFDNRIKAAKWKQFVEEIKSDYIKLVEELKKSGVENPNEYGAIVQKKHSIEKRLSVIDSSKKMWLEINKQISETYEKIKKWRKEITDKRQNFIDTVLKDNKFVKIDVIRCGDTKNLETDFREIINKTTGEFKDDILSEDREKGILSGLYAGFTDDKLEGLKKTIHDLRADTLARQVSDRRFSAHVEKMSDEMIDSLELWFPKDFARVCYSRDGIDFSSIEQGSPGQKTAAILAFILAYGVEPIILDQPEDDLDNHLITDLVVKQIRENKCRRQIIIVTHNPNIVVNGDAEKVISLHFPSGQTKISVQGCLQENKVRTEICDIMEGGKIAFKQRYCRINVTTHHRDAENTEN